MDGAEIFGALKDGREGALNSGRSTLGAAGALWRSTSELGSQVISRRQRGREDESI